MMLTSSRLLPIGLVVSALAWQLHAATPAPAPWETPPGWTDTRGGAGGKVIRVTTLAAAGPGSLAEAIATKGPRIVEFAVAGTIELNGKGLRIKEPFLTIAGETAPSPGITLLHGGVGIQTHDVIVRHLRIHAGDGPDSKLITTHEDGLSTGGGAHDVIVDHCSLVWGTDETLSASGPRFNGNTPDEWRENTSHRITFSHCIVGEGMHEYNSKGTLIHDNATDIAIIGNFYVSNNDRQPACKGGVRAAMVNNFIYDPGHRVMQFAYVPGQWTGHEPQRAALTMAGNVVRKGPSSAPEIAFFEIWPAYGLCDFYLGDNLMFDAGGRSLPVAAGFRDKTRPTANRDKTVPDSVGMQYDLSPYVAQDGMRRVDQAPLWPPRLVARPAAETEAWVLANAGARPWDRDATDRRLVEEAKTGGGKVLRMPRHEAEKAPVVKPPRKQ